MKKYRVVDDVTGESMTVEELEKDSEMGKEEIAPQHDEETDSLTAEEIAALKRLAAVADKLIGMTTDSDCADEDKDEDDELHDEDEDDEDKGEELVDTDETVEEAIVKKTNDSKKSVGSIEKKKNTVSDSVDHDLEVEDAWAKRYGGK